MYITQISTGIFWECVCVCVSQWWVGGRLPPKGRQNCNLLKRRKTSETVMLKIMNYEALKSFTQYLLAHIGRIPSLRVRKRTQFHPRPTNYTAECKLLTHWTEATAL
jgi:hypothetical protein